MPAITPRSLTVAGATAVLLVSFLAWPVAHIGNLPVVAVPVNIALVVAFGSLVWARAGAASS